MNNSHNVMMMPNSELIRIVNHDGIAVVGSREVAENFGKEHSKVIRSIETIKGNDSSQNWPQYFLPSNYIDNSGKSNKQYLMTRDGFSLLVMGFTGKEALHWKLKYIEAFNKMEFALKQNFGGFTIPKTLPEALRLAADLQEKNESLEAKVEQDKPKVAFANAVGVSKTSITVNVMAKLLAQNGVKIGVNRLYAWLRDNGYLIKSGENKNVPLQKAVDAGLFEIKQKPRYDHYGRMIINKTALITGKGQLHLVKRLTQEPETLE